MTILREFVNNACENRSLTENDGIWDESLLLEKKKKTKRAKQQIHAHTLTIGERSLYYI